MNLLCWSLEVLSCVAGKFYLASFKFLFKHSFFQIWHKVVQSKQFIMTFFLSV